jgi:peroxiredoxin
MKKQSRHISIAVMAVVMITLLSADLHAQERAPDFTLRDLQGRIFSLKDYRAKATLLIFGTTWCPSCRSEIPHFKKIFSTYTPRGLEVAYVNIMEPRDKVLRFNNKYQLPYRTLLDASGAVANAYDVVGVPAMILIRDGRVLTRHYRLIDGYLEKLFKK